MDDLEKGVISYVLKAGEIYGYGNLIAHLKTAWIKSLMEKWQFTYEQAKIAADVEPLKDGEK